MAEQSSRIPSLPSLEDGEALKVVFNPTSSDAFRDGMSIKEHHQRLQGVGRAVLEAEVLHVLYGQFPALVLDALEAKKAAILSIETLSTWVLDLGITTAREKFADYLSDRENQRACVGVLLAYIGAMSLEKDDGNLQARIRQLVKWWLDTRAIDEADEMAIEGAEDPIADGRDFVPFTSSMSPGWTTVALPPLDQPWDGSSFGNFRALGMFRQKATQAKSKVEQRERHQGSDHGGIWTEELYVDGRFVGRGSGPNKQLAKDIAAKMAMATLQWGDA